MLTFKKISLMIFIVVFTFPFIKTNACLFRTGQEIVIEVRDSKEEGILYPWTIKPDEICGSSSRIPTVDPMIEK